MSLINGNAPCISSTGSAFLKTSHLKANTMLDLFIELTNQIFWDGYAQQLAKESPAIFQLEYNDFLTTYNQEL